VISICIARVLVIAVSLILWFWTQRLLAGRAPLLTSPEFATICDGIHRLTPRTNKLLTDYPHLANAVLISSSLVIDLLGLYLLGSAIFGPTIQPFFGLLMLFALRQFCQAFCPLPPPSGMIWRETRFPTLFVTYGTSNDLFFSGHTAIAVYGAAVLATALGPIGVAVGLFIALFEISAVLLLRAHYTMDVFTGAITAPVHSSPGDGLVPRDRPLDRARGRNDWTLNRVHCFRS
jgi:PAP2 superfamily C-terminal